MKLADVRMPQRLLSRDAFGWVELEQALQKVQCIVASSGENLPEGRRRSGVHQSAGQPVEVKVCGGMNVCGFPFTQASEISHADLLQLGFSAVWHGVNQHACETRLDAVHVLIAGSPSELQPTAERPNQRAPRVW